MKSTSVLTPLLALATALIFAAVGCGENPRSAPARAKAERRSPRPAIAAEPAGVTNHPPLVESIRFEPEEPISGDRVRALVEASDGDDDSISFRYEWTLAGETLDVDGSELNLTGAQKGDYLELRVWANDGQVEGADESESIRIGNSPPSLDRITIEPSRAIVAGTDIVARPDARDADGDALTFRYEWTVDGRSVYEDGSVLSTRKLRRGQVAQVSVVAHDGEDASETLQSPELPIANAPPRIVSQPGAPPDGGVFRYQVRAEDPDGDEDFQFELEQAPDGMQVDSTKGIITWEPAPDQSGTHDVFVTVDDLHGGRIQQRFEVTVGDADAGSPAAGNW